MSDPQTAWAEALDQFEARLDAFRAVLYPDGEPPSGLWPPPDLIGSPLPLELVDRARELLAGAKALEGELVARRTELAPLHRPTIRHRRRPVSSTFSAAV
jgi:hypothetical protein